MQPIKKPAFGVGGSLTQKLGHEARKQAEKAAEKVTDRAAEPAIVLTAAERAERHKALRNLMGLNKHREGGPVDGLEFQLEQRAEW